MFRASYAYTGRSGPASSLIASRPHLSSFMKRHLFAPTAALALLLSFATADLSYGQTPLPSEMELTQRYAPPGVPTQTIYIWGSVGVPGVWRVEQDIDLVELLSAARLTGVGRDDPGVRESNRIQVYRRSGGEGRELVYEASLDDVLSPGATYPTLQDQDVIEVETVTRNRFGFRDAISLIGTGASLTLLVLRIVSGRGF